MDATPFKIGMAVPDLERAMEELTVGMGLKWSVVVETEWDTGKLRIAFSRTARPYIELIEGPIGSPWDASAGARVANLGYWSEDVDTDRAHLEQRGMPVVVDGKEHGRTWVWHGGRASGLTMELNDGAQRTALEAYFGLAE
jgi:hypothetical protein